MLVRALAVTSLFVTSHAYAQAVRSAFPPLREYRETGLSYNGRGGADPIFCLIRKKTGQTVCKDKAGWIAENARLGKFQERRTKN